jgi:hypothetical protein
LLALRFRPGRLCRPGLGQSLVFLRASTRRCFLPSRPFDLTHSSSRGLSQVLEGSLNTADVCADFPLEAGDSSLEPCEEGQAIGPGPLGDFCEVLGKVGKHLGDSGPAILGSLLQIREESLARLSPGGDLIAHSNQAVGEDVHRCAPSMSWVFSYRLTGQASGCFR